MKEIPVERISLAVQELCIEANRVLPCAVKELLAEARRTECSVLGCSVLSDIEENYRQAERLSLPVCQDTGTAVVFAQVGQELRITGGSFEEAINEGVRCGYLEGFLRCSVVGDPLRRVNTQDNTPAVIHTRVVPGDTLTLTVAPKGAGSENMSSIAMLTPAASPEDITDFVVQAVSRAGSNPCPPVIVGVGIGGNFESCALAAKEALCRDSGHEDPYYRALEQTMLQRINRLGIGPQGFGGSVTALSVQIEYRPTHIASLPVAVNMGCHVTRHASSTL